MGAVREIANGKSLWKGELSDDMKRLQYFLKHNYIFCTSHAQFIERAVKDAAFSGQTGAEERRRNELSIIRSHLLEQTISLAQILQVHGEPSSKSHTPQGSKLTATFLNEVERQANIDISQEEVKTAVVLLSKENQYKERRQTNWLRKITTARKKRRVIQNKAVDYTAGLRRLVPYGKIRKNIYIPQLHRELDF